MTKRYTQLAVVLHWLIGLGFVCMLASGFIMVQEGLLPDETRWSLYAIHKASGIIMLCAVALRIGVRLLNKAPKLPEKMPKLERKAAYAGHALLYVLMALIPLTGWLLVSLAQYQPVTSIYGLFGWPHIPGIAMNRELAGTVSGLHEFFAFVLIGVISLHVLAVIKHIWFDKINLLPRMWFGK